MINFNFSIMDIAKINGIEPFKEQGGEYYCECPFCNDKRGKFSFIVEKKDKSNLFKCFHCNKSGNLIKLHEELNPGLNSFKEVLNDINKKLNKGHLSPRFISKTEEPYKTSVKDCSIIYIELLKRFNLNEEHKKDLLRRGLTEEQIKKFKFKSAPSKNVQKKIAKELGNKYDLNGVPGFFTDKDGNWSLDLPKGYLCPVYDTKLKLLLGFQIRQDNPVHAKYIWVSSASKTNGTSSGSLSTYLLGEHQDIIILTEGILKATVIFSLLKGKITVIGVPGISAINNCISFLERSTNTFLFEAYDMDKYPKKNSDEDEIKKSKRILEAANKIKDIAKNHLIMTHSLTWDTDKDGFWNGKLKGLDDFLNSYENKEEFLDYLINKGKNSLNLVSYLS